MSDPESRKALNDWFRERMKLGHTFVAIKGPAPKGATYSDGSPIDRPMNVAWLCVETGERFDTTHGEQR